MISILTWTFNWQKMFDITIPCLLAQEGVEFEVLAGCGPNITLPNHPKLRRIDIEGKGKCAAYNRLIDEAKGELLFMSQADMEVSSPTQLKRMLDVWHPKLMVTERFWKYGKRDNGLFHQCMLVAKEEVVDAGKCDEAFDDPSLYAYEDTDLVVRLMKRGCRHKILETPKEGGVFHIDHPAIDTTDPIIAARIKKAKEYYESKHGNATILSLHFKQLAASLSTRRIAW